MPTSYPYKLGFGALPARFGEDFEPQQHEYLVAAGGGGTTGTGIVGREDNPPMAMAHTLGYIELDTGRKHGTRSDVRWDVPEEEFKSRAYRRHFEEGVIYRVKGFPAKNRETLQTEYARGVIYVTEVLGAYFAEPFLLGLIEEYNKPVTLRSDILGEITLDKRRDVFEGRCDWLGTEVRMRFYGDGKDSPAENVKRLERLWLDRERWDVELRVFAAKDLTDTANEWLDDYNYDAEEKLPPVTEEEFARRLTLESVCLYDGGKFEAYFDDGGMNGVHAMFAGHTVTVSADMEKGAESAELMG